MSNKKYNVYRDNEANCLFSDGITRVFGLNKVIATEGSNFVASVQPLNVDPEDYNLELIGTIETDEPPQEEE